MNTTARSLSRLSKDGCISPKRCRLAEVSVRQWHLQMRPGNSANSNGAVAPPLAVLAPDIAEEARQTWTQVLALVSPVVGRQGANALYRRSLYRSRADNACLRELYQRSAAADVDLMLLHSALAPLSAAQAAQAQQAFLQRFKDLLAQLIGMGLAERLLQPLKVPNRDAIHDDYNDPTAEDHSR